MYINSTYKEKFANVNEWMPQILEVVKKDLRNDHIKQDFVFLKKYLKGKNPSKVTLEDMVEGYPDAIQNEERGEEIAEFISNRWMLHKSDLYHYFEKELARINPEFTEIKEIAPSDASNIIEGAVKKFGVLDVYLFSVINSVAFSKSDFEKLAKDAKTANETKKEEDAKLKEMKDFENLKKEFETKLGKLKEKYEDKIEGLQKKYVTDIDSCRKQISNLQKKLNAVS